MAGSTRHCCPNHRARRTERTASRVSSQPLRGANPDDRNGTVHASSRRKRRADRTSSSPASCTSSNCRRSLPWLSPYSLYKAWNTFRYFAESAMPLRCESPHHLIAVGVIRSSVRKAGGFPAAVLLAAQPLEQRGCCPQLRDSGVRRLREP